jgi:hypothetical protein
MSDFTLSQQQLDVIAALSNGATIAIAAELAGVHRNTIAYWRRENLTFQKTLSHAYYDRAMLAREKAEALLDIAIKTLQGILVDEKAPAGVRLKAALAVIQTASTPPAPQKEYMLEVPIVPAGKNAAQICTMMHKPPPRNRQHHPRRRRTTPAPRRRRTTCPPPKRKTRTKLHNRSAAKRPKSAATNPAPAEATSNTNAAASTKMHKPPAPAPPEAFSGSRYPEALLPRPTALS